MQILIIIISCMFYVTKIFRWKNTHKAHLCNQSSEISFHFFIGGFFCFKPALEGPDVYGFFTDGMYLTLFMSLSVSISMLDLSLNLSLVRIHSSFIFLRLAWLLLFLFFFLNLLIYHIFLNHLLKYLIILFKIVHIH